MLGEQGSAAKAATLLLQLPQKKAHTCLQNAAEAVWRHRLFRSFVQQMWWRRGSALDLLRVSSGYEHDGRKTHQDVSFSRGI